ncbi:aminotransferase class V-fold PLP-dependent enzyme [Ruegeria pomeroyi]|uniref:Aminotransferase, putative n=2 Tax=Ruegeria pomeroyi TaxID=89184 RepID=Q5LT47_RUEPO|nr:aminotransferase class V-fold PLP-dependent enzyme [Ruegeria pomeroyi]HCE71135.1 alanine--glyoxylate aminotransferase family protein [Ruegeria sp.]AAV94854.1 aminotransferase, putative [Ruegeria pomeroyi DSS-3]NVK95501.1 alanine--glyoxylate aminotransferase family protein [Ruegeria pomeroyi]NVL02179.1 alanine--glyoxylate aminotransferase family protein [Ruegeria pomeroyi]QWV08427.1 aminotransferase class V-fold PLP-dependent enzyme [Ruegeria pomeroyi]
MSADTLFPKLDIPATIAAGPGPGNTDARVLAAFSGAGLADHMHGDVLRGMVECKLMLRRIWGTDNIHTFGVAGTGWSGLDVMFSAVMPGDKVVVFTNGTFSGIDGLTVRMKAATAEELAANPLDPRPASVVIVDIPHGQSVTGEIVETALAEHKPKWAAMAHWETGSGRINDIAGFSAACERHDVMGLVDAVSSLGVEDFRIDDFPGVHGWASCPQKGICCLPLTYAPVSFTDRYIQTLRATGTRSFVHHPILEARHWGVIEGKDVDKGTYHRTHSAYAVAAFHEALRITLQQGVANRAKDYAYHEAALRRAVEALGCEVTSNMTSLVVLNLPGDLRGREMELVQNCRARNFGIWPTLSAPVQVRIGILNLLSRAAVTDIVTRFAEAIRELGGAGDEATALAALDAHYDNAIAAE